MKPYQSFYSEAGFLNFSAFLTVELTAFAAQDCRELNLKCTFSVILHAVKRILLLPKRLLRNSN